MAYIEHFKRRCGNTTRQVDEWVQQLFHGRSVIVSDHAHIKGNYANECAERILLRRLEIEHNLKPGEKSVLKYNKRTRAYSLMPSKYISQ